MPASLLRSRPSRLKRLEAVVEWLLAGSGSVPAGKGIPFFKNGAEFQVHVNPITGADQQQTDGSPAKPFKTFRAVYERQSFLSNNDPPDLGLIITPTVPTFHVFQDASFPTADAAALDPATILLDVFCPKGGTLIIDGSPAQTSTPVTVNAVVQTQNYALAPAHFQVLSQTGGGDAGGLVGKIIVDTTIGGAAWCYRGGANGGGFGTPQVAGAPNFQVSRFLSPAVSTTGFTPAANYIWPGAPAAVSPGGGDTCVAIGLPLASAATGGAGFTVRGSIAGAAAVSAQAFVYRMGFVDGGQFAASGYGAQMSFVQCSFNDITSFGQATSGYNCHFNPLVVQRAVDLSVIGGWIRNKLGVNQATNVTVDAVIMDSCTMQVGTAGGTELALGEVGFYVLNLATPGIDLASGAIGSQSGFYTNQIGYAAALNAPFRTSPNTVFIYNFAAVFGALSGSPTTIGFYPWPLAIYATWSAIHDPYSGAFGGQSQGISVYPVTEVQGEDATGTALTNALAAQPGAATQFYVSAVGGNAWAMQVDAESVITAGGGGATVSYQIWVDGAASTDPVVGPIVLTAGQVLPVARSARIQGLTSALHTFSLALVASAGTASTAAHDTRVLTTVVPTS